MASTTNVVYTATTGSTSQQSAKILSMAVRWRVAHVERDIALRGRIGSFENFAVMLEVSNEIELDGFGDRAEFKSFDDDVIAGSNPRVSRASNDLMENPFRGMAQDLDIIARSLCPVYELLIPVPTQVRPPFC